MSFNLTTSRLTLTLQTPAEALAMVESLSPEERAEVSPVWMARVQAATQPDPWVHSFAIVETASGAIVGHGGFKSPPCDGVVEVAYGIHPDHQNRGYATEACRVLAEFARGCETVKTIIAHTREENIPSQRVLEKCGFRNTGPVNDPEDGWVQRWRRDYSR